jgi:hypothetical protein
MPPREVLFEGLREEDILNLLQEEVELLIQLGEPLVFRIGSATLLGSFKVENERLVIELAQIEGGGEGVLVSLSLLARRYAKLRQLSGIEWIVHAVSCAKPNLKLKHVLERRGFVVKQIVGVGEAYYLLDPIGLNRLEKYHRAVLDVVACLERVIPMIENLRHGWRFGIAQEASH